MQSFLCIPAPPPENWHAGQPGASQHAISRLLCLSCYVACIYSLELILSNLPSCRSISSAFVRGALQALQKLKYQLRHHAHHIRSAGAAGGGDAGADAKTAARLRELEGAKARAVAEEDYDEAKRLKLAIDRLKAVATQLSDLEARWVHLIFF